MVEVYKHDSEWVFITDSIVRHGFKAPTAVSVIHVPSGLRADCDIYSSPHKNRAEAKAAIENKLAQK